MHAKLLMLLISPASSFQAGYFAVQRVPDAGAANRRSMAAISKERSWWDVLLNGQRGAPPPPPPLPTLAEVYAQLDSDADGVLDAEEARRGLALLGLKELDFEKIDADGDGVLTYEEFATALSPEAKASILERVAAEGGKLQSKYVPPEEWTDTRSAKALAWDQKVQMEAQREGSGTRQNDILRDELGKG